MFGFLLRKKQIKREIIINAEDLETRVAIVENGRVEEYQMEHPTEERIVGSVFKGRIQNLESGLRAAFVDIGLKKNAFIHYWDMIPEDSERLEVAESGTRGGGGGGGGGRRRGRTHEEIVKMFPVGSEIIVQVSKGPIGTKGPRVTANISLPGRYLVLLPGSTLRGISRKIDDQKARQRLRKVLARLPVPDNTGLIVRTVADEVNQRSIVRDMRSLIAIWEDMQRRMQSQPVPSCIYEEPSLVERVVRDWLTEDVDRIVVDSRKGYERIREVGGMFGRRMRSRIQLYEGIAPIFEHFDLERKIEESFRRRITLKSGGYIIFEETEAMIAVDVNTGRHKAKSHEDAILEVNMEAVDEVARQLRLRNVGGLVLIDLVDMASKKHQNMVYRAFRDAMRKDKARTNVLPISKLGVLEMSRQRVEESILSSTYCVCPYCDGRGRVKSPLTTSAEIQRHIAAVIRKLRGEKEDIKLQILVHPSVLERLRQEDEAILVDMESRLGARLTFRGDPARHYEGFTILDADTGGVLYSAERQVAAFTQQRNAEQRNVDRA